MNLSSSGDVCPSHGNTNAAIGSSLFTASLFINLFPLSHPSPPSWCSPSPMLTESIGVKLGDHRRGATSIRDLQSFVKEENCVILCRRENERWKKSFVFGVEEEEERKREF
ncbi:predicted protein [Arabidopsis lyrata subsp. lyrata]|uniref:Predicted protein n=1 Tax=Arabidopsis lyrata subsp. lyrata TaxID=81972 RepID=D7LAE1_ARALL|nr:predicted protein [Arabidopsis lyrata subsp. lyrata]